MKAKKARKLKVKIVLRRTGGEVVGKIVNFKGAVLMEKWAPRRGFRRLLELLHGYAKEANYMVVG